jgi:hypothetical protein
MNSLSGQFWLATFAIFFSFGSTSFARPIQDSPAEVIRKLQNYDKVYLTALSASGTVQRGPSPLSPLTPTVLKTWRYSVSDRRIALVESSTDEVLKSAIFKYQPPAKELDNLLGRGLSHDEAGNMIDSVKTSGAWSFENDRSARLSGNTVVRVSPGGELLSTKKSQIFSYYGPEATTLTVPILFVNWVMGRGFSPCLQQITSVQFSADGTLDIVAVGSFGPKPDGGKWELNVDQNSQYLVRKATFYAKNQTIAFVNISNQSITHDGACIYPADGTCELLMSDDTAPIRTKFTFSKVRLATDEALLVEARKLTDDASAPGSVIADSRVQPEKHTVVREIETSPPIKRRWSFVLSVSIGLVVLGIVAGVLGYRRRKR